MSQSRIRVMHYINQFFGGIGGEEHGDTGLEIREGAVGPGTGLEQLFGERGEVVATLICGDNHFSDDSAGVVAAILKEVRDRHPDVFVAGPAFNAGRYGFACGEVARAVTNKIQIPAVTGMYSENPATETYRKVSGLWILPTGAMASDMRNVLPKLAQFVLKVGSGAAIGPANAEGYVPTGRRKLESTGVPGAERALAMLLDKLSGKPYETEVPVEQLEQIPPATLAKEVKKARVAVITTSGLVPKGNPDGFRMFNASEWRTYPLPDRPALRSEDWEVIHGGFNTAYAQANPNLVLPLDALRALAGSQFGELHNHFYSITGVGTALSVARRAGEEIATSMRGAQIDAALLVAT